ncbi:hypothetical protein AAFN47_25725 [Hoeflea sp. CAU 1731]
MSITWNEIVEVYRSQPWWVWAVRLGFIWFGLKWLTRAATAYVERPIATPGFFKQRRVTVDYRAGTITMPRGNAYPVSSVRGLRWEDFSRTGSFHAYVEVDDLTRPTHPVSFSTADGPETFVGRLRTAIEKAGGAHFVATATDRLDLVERDLSNPITAATVTRVYGQGQRVSYGRLLSTLLVPKHETEGTALARKEAK